MEIKVRFTDKSYGTLQYIHLIKLQYLKILVTNSLFNIQIVDLQQFFIII